MSNAARFIGGKDVFARWQEDVLHGGPPTYWPVGWSHFRIGPRMVAILGGAPGAGKTAFVMQCAVDALRYTPSLRALVANCEMPPSALLDRQLARLSGVDLSTICGRRIDTECKPRIDEAIDTFGQVIDRMAFLEPPFDIRNVHASIMEWKAELVVIDYIQRFSVPGQHADMRAATNAMMDYLRRIANAGAGVLAVSALGRTKDTKGRASYTSEALNLASYRETSEIEYGCDDAYILTSDGSDAVLRHLKSRYSETRDMVFTFGRAIQQFILIDKSMPCKQQPSKVGTR